MKKLRLNLEQLGEQMELLDVDYLRGIKGGYDGEGGYGEYATFGGYGDDANPIPLDLTDTIGGGSIGGFWGMNPPQWLDQNDSGEWVNNIF